MTSARLKWKRKRQHLSRFLRDQIEMAEAEYGFAALAKCSEAANYHAQNARTCLDRVERADPAACKAWGDWFCSEDYKREKVKS